MYPTDNAVTIAPTAASNREIAISEGSDSIPSIGAADGLFASRVHEGRGPRPFLRSPPDRFFRKTPGSNPSHKLPRELPRAKRRPGAPRKTSRPSLGHQPRYRETWAM